MTKVIFLCALNLDHSLNSAFPAYRQAGAINIPHSQILAVNAMLSAP